MGLFHGYIWDIMRSFSFLGWKKTWTGPLKVNLSNRGFEKNFFPLRKSYFFPHQSTGFCFLIPKRYDTQGLLSCNPLLLKIPLISLRGFSGKEGCRLLIPQCHTFLKSESKTLLIGEEKHIILCKGEKFVFFKSPIWRMHSREASPGFFFTWESWNFSWCLIYTHGRAPYSENLSVVNWPIYSNTLHKGWGCLG